jgi:energy-coupling factor transport system ATP-binding protein
MNSAIEIEDVTFQYRYSEKKALDAVSLSIEEGEFVGIFGASGAGKTSLVRTINRIIPTFFKGAFSGRVRLAGSDISHQSISEMSLHCGMLFQDFESQLFSTNVEQEIVFGCENLGIPREEMRKRLERYLEFVALEKFQGRSPSSLSGGEKQRLAIASILAMQNSFLIMDEPTTDLDPVGKEAIFDILSKLRKEQRTVLLIEHETEEALLCDKIILFDEGKVVIAGHPEEIFRKIDLLLEKGVKPPDLGLLSDKLSLRDLPFHPEEAFLFLKDRGYSLNEKKFHDMRCREEEEQSESREEIVGAQDLSFAYESGKEVLSDINLSIQEGEFIAILGANGSGKTTLVKHFNRLLKPSSGTVFFKGRDISEEHVSQMGKRVGYVFQNPDYQIFSKTIREEVSFGPSNFDFPAGEVTERVRRALETVGLQGREEEDPFAVTKGERQKIAVASIIASSPEVIIMDEPTTGLDYRDQKNMMSLLKTLNKAGHTIIIITHSIWLAAEYARRVIVMANGRIVKDDSPRNLFADETTLQKAKLKSPRITQLGKCYGVPVLSVDEFVALFT